MLDYIYLVVRVYSSNENEIILIEEQKLKITDLTPESVKDTIEKLALEIKKKLPALSASEQQIVQQQQPPPLDELLSNAGSPINSQIKYSPEYPPNGDSQQPSVVHDERTCLTNERE